MQLSNQAIGAVMMALQKSLMEQSDIVPVLRSFVLSDGGTEGLVVENPPMVDLSTAVTSLEQEDSEITDADV